MTLTGSDRKDLHNMRGKQQTQTDSVIVLKEEQVLFGGLSLYYRFTVEGREGIPHFGIMVELNEELAKGYLGNQLVRAWNLYLKIVKGAVTPCSLDDVLADWVSV